MVSDGNLRGEEMIKGVDGNENNGGGIVMEGALPLK